MVSLVVGTAVVGSGVVLGLRESTVIPVNVCSPGSVVNLVRTYHFDACESFCDVSLGLWAARCEDEIPTRF